MLQRLMVLGSEKRREANDLSGEKYGEKKEAENKKITVIANRMVFFLVEIVCSL